LFVLFSFLGEACLFLCLFCCFLLLQLLGLLAITLTQVLGGLGDGHGVDLGLLFSLRLCLGSLPCEFFSTPLDEGSPPRLRSLTSDGRILLGLDLLDPGGFRLPCSFFGGAPLFSSFSLGLLLLTLLLVFLTLSFGSSPLLCQRLLLPQRHDGFLLLLLLAKKGLPFGFNFGQACPLLFLDAGGLGLLDGFFLRQLSLPEGLLLCLPLLFGALSCLFEDLLLSLLPLFGLLDRPRLSFLSLLLEQGLLVGDALGHLQLNLPLRQDLGLLLL